MYWPTKSHLHCGPSLRSGKTMEGTGEVALVLLAGHGTGVRAVLNGAGASGEDGSRIIL
jgi:hypothetical protein